MKLKVQEILTKVNVYSLLVLAFFIPLARRPVPILIAVLFLTTLLNFRQWSKAPWKWYELPLAIFYIVGAVSLLWTENHSAGLFDLEVKLSFIVFPIAFHLMGNFYTKHRKQVESLYLIGCTVSVLVNIALALFSYIVDNDTSAFNYKYLSHFQHTSYYAMFLCFGAIVVFRKIIGYENTMQLFLRLMQLIVFSVVVILLESRAGYLLLLISYLIGLILLLKKRRQVLKWIFVAFVPLILIGYGFRSSIIQRVSEALATVENVNAGEVHATSSGIRLLIWKEAGKLIAEAPMLGVGAGDVRDELADTYLQEGLLAAYEQKLNAHNQFVQVAIGLGMLGLLALAYLLGAGLIVGVRTKNLMFLSFLAFITVSFIFESMLETQAGVVFFAFFYQFYIVKVFGQSSSRL